MKKIYFLLIALCCVSLHAVAQTYVNPTSGSASATTCSGTYYSSNGGSGAYQNNESGVYTFYPSTPGAKVKMTFSTYYTECSYDYLYIYNGATVGAPLLYTANCTTIPPTYTSTASDGSLTFRFSSDVSVTYIGWIASISCFIPPPAASATATTVAFGPVVVGTTSAVQIFSVTGTNLSPTAGNDTVTAPSGFEVSTDGSTWSSFVTIPYTGGSFVNKPVYIHFIPTAYASYTNTVTLTGGGVSSAVNITVTGNGVFPCSGTPSIGSASVSPTSGNSGTTFSLSIPAITSVGGVTYQWQQFNPGMGTYFANIPGATTATYSLAGISATTYFRVIVTCSTTGSSVTSNIVSATLSPAGTACAGIPTAGSVGTNVTSGCAPSYLANMYYTSSDPATGGLFYQWQVSPDNTTWSNVSGATAALYTATVTATKYYRVMVGCANSGGTDYTASQQLAFNALPSPITGVMNVCTATPSTLSSAPSGGTWASSNSSIANAGLTTGVITAVSPGTANITYTAPTGCTATAQVSVNTSPASISGASNVCAGSTLSLSDIYPGGTWSSSNSSFATVGSASGVVSGVSAGTANISYTLANGCSSVDVISINPVPAPITGASNVCIGATTTLSNTTAGGTWGSSNAFQASVSSAGVVTGIAAGSPSIMYTLPTGCMSVLPLTVNALPAAISGTTAVCVGATTSLSDAGGGTWSVTPTSIATAGAATGIITGITAGTATATYTLPGTGCMITTPVTVNPSPTVYNVTVTGGGGYCPGGTGVHIGLTGSQNSVNYQLYYGSSPVSGALLPGSSSGLDFGLFTAAGIYTVQATNATTGCVGNMSGSANVFVQTPPTAFTVGGGGNYCAGGAGVPVTLSGSTVGVTYQLQTGFTTVGTLAGTGGPLNFGLKTVAGTYTILATSTSTGCTNNMSGSATVGITSLPAVYTVTAPGGSSYCSGGTGVDIQLSNSDPGIVYRLYKNTLPTNDSLAGAGISINLGYQTAAGAYTIIARDPLTTCTSTMSGTINVVVNPLPLSYTVTGGGNYCAGSGGAPVGINFSVIGTNYELFRNGVSTGLIMPGASSSISFGPQTTAGIYTVSATIAATGCASGMLGSVTVGINPLPNAYSITAPGGSGYCAGGAGVNIVLNGSDAGISYQLYNGAVSAGPSMTGTGGTLNFGLHTAPGSYTIVATNTSTLCTRTMTGSIPVTVNPLPTAFNVGGGGNYCAGGTGSMVTLSGSSTGINYRLSLGGGAVGSSVAGTGSPLNMGLQTTPGVYTIIATDATTGCTRTMNGNTAVGINPAPAAYSVTGGGPFCAGGSGVHVGLGLSASGISYQLKNGATTVGTLLGTGASLDFGLQTGGGAYTILATNSTTGCTATMTGTATVTVNAIPTVYTVMGGGTFCAGTGGVHDSLSSSDLGISYQLYNGGVPAGTAVAGTGAALDFGAVTNSGIYKVVARNTTTGCTDTMASGAVVTANPAPHVYTVSGGGSYCASAGGVHVLLSGSDLSAQYQLWLGGALPVGGTWSGTAYPLDFGVDTAAGVYTVTAIFPATGCSSNMAGSATISVIPSVVPAVTINTSSAMRDTVCAGSRITFTAVPVNGGLSPTYQWKVNGITVGSGGSYSYVPSSSDNVTVALTSNAACASPATVSNTMRVTQMAAQTPAVNIAVTPGATICPGTAVTFTASPVYGGTAPSYTWLKNGDSVGTGNTFGYTPADGDLVFATMMSNYTCLTSGFAISNDYVINVNNPVMPVVTLQVNPGTTVGTHSNVAFTAAVDNALQSNPSYAWTINGATVAGATNATFVTNTLTNNSVVCARVTGNNSCGSSAPAVQCETITVYNNEGVSTVTGSGLDVKVIPNPNRGLFTIKGSTPLTGDQEITIEVTNMLGQSVYTGKAMTHNGNINEKVQLNGSLANGMYLLNIRTGSDNVTFHFVVEN
jgi:hypothetical protein